MVKPKKPRRPTKRRERAARDGDTEQRILDAAHRVFIRRGTTGARTQEIADEAGVNKALLHYYFRSKSRLAEAVFHRVARALFARVGEIAASDLPLHDKVRRLIDIYLRQLMTTPYAPAYVIGEINQHPERVRQFIGIIGQIREQPVIAQALASLERQIAAEVRAGTMRPIAAQQFMVNLVSLCIFPFAARPMLHAMLGLDQDAFRAFIEERKRSLPDFFLNALRP